MQQFSSLLSWRLFTAQHVSGVSPHIIRSSMTAVGASGFYLRIVVTVVLCLWSGEAHPRTQHGYHHDTKVKPEAATAVIELLMICGETPETCWAVNKRQDNKPENYCIWLVIYLNCNFLSLSNTILVMKLMRRAYKNIQLCKQKWKGYIYNLNTKRKQKELFWNQT
jgi:hypothetical protein